MHKNQIFTQYSVINSSRGMKCKKILYDLKNYIFEYINSNLTFPLLYFSQLIGKICKFSISISNQFIKTFFDVINIDSCSNMSKKLMNKLFYA